MKEQQLKTFLAGFDLAGRILPNGKIQPYVDGEPIDEWPEEIELAGNTYVLETIEDGEEMYQTAIYC